LSDPFDFSATLAAARRGDREARERLLVRYYPTVERMAHNALLGETPYRRLGLMALFSTGDIVQETCRQVLNNLDDFQGESEASFVSYLTAVVHNRLFDMLRFHHRARRDRNRHTREGELPDSAAHGPGPSRLAAASEEAQLFLATLEGMPPRDRRLLIGRLENGDTFQKLADDLGISSADHARKLFHRAQATLLVRLRRAGLSVEALPDDREGDPPGREEEPR
jgi:RNA polymerase sigma factor (sigma-70 family)